MTLKEWLQAAANNATVLNPLRLNSVTIRILKNKVKRIYVNNRYYTDIDDD